MESFATKNPNRRVNVISLEIKDTEGKTLQQSGIIMRTTRSYAAKLLSAGTHTITSKGKLKSFLNKSSKLQHNKRTLSGIDFSNKKLGHIQVNDSFSGKTYILIKRGEVETIMMKKGVIDPNTGKPLEVKMMMPRYQTFIAAYPE